MSNNSHSTVRNLERLKNTEAIVKERSCIYIINNRGPTIDSWGTPCFNAIQSEKILLVSFGDYFIFVFC